VGCSLHFESVETSFAFRTRVLDYIWAGLPMVVTRGDEASEWVERHGLGAVVDYLDVGGVAAAIEGLIAKPRSEFAARFERARRARSWEECARPLAQYCQNPRHAPDKALDREWANARSQQHVRSLEREVARLRALVAGYEQGRLMRLLRWLHGVRRKVRERFG
jgi:hypothetical protein